MSEVFVPRENVNDDTVIIQAIYVNSGDYVNKGQLILSIETSKINIDIESPEPGLLSHSLKVGTEIEIGALLFSVGSQDLHSQNLKSETSAPNFDTLIKVSKAARKRANELGVDTSNLGVEWVSTKDVEKSAGLILHSPNISPIIQKNSNDSVAVSLPAKNELISKRKQAEIKNLEIGKHESTSSTIGINIVAPGQRIVTPPILFQNSISDLIVFEGSKLLRKYPELNSTFANSKTIAKYDDINFGWSFDNGSNLKVLSIFNSDQLSLTDLQNEITRLLDLYDSNQKLSMEMLSSSTVTLSDLSQTNASFMLPLLNGLQSLILGIVQHKVNNFSIFATFDHRVSEGLRVANFLSDLKSRILSYYFDDHGNASIHCYSCEKTIAEEISLGNRGFLKITLSNGNDANICHNCLAGY